MYRALYEYKNRMPEYLSFKAGDQFTILDRTNKDWLLAQNGMGQIGYVPYNYIKSVKMMPEEVLKFIDWSIEAIHLQVTGEQGGQYSSQQRTNLQLLVKHRSELAVDLQTRPPLERAQSETAPYQGSGKRRSAPPPPTTGVSRQSSTKTTPAPPPPYESPLIDSETVVTGTVENGNGSLESSSTALMETSPHKADDASVEDFPLPPPPEPESMPAVTVKDLLQEVPIPDKIGPELLEEVRKSTGLSFEKSKIAVETVLGYVGCKMPDLEVVVDKILNSLHFGRDISDEDVSSHDAQRLTVIFTELTACKDDSQQRSWALYEDESVIHEYLEELLSILENAKPAICRKVVARDNYDILHSFVQYYQMETRAMLCRLLLKVFGALCSLQKEVVSHLLYSVLPLELGQELRAHTEDVQRMCYVALVMTMIFSTGDPVSTAVTDQLNQEFFLHVLDLIENPPSPQFEDDAVNLLVTFVLSFNLHLSPADAGNNPVLRALATFAAPKVFTEHIMVLVNRGDDPVKMFEYKPAPPNSVIKLFHDLYSDPVTSDLLYTNDAKVLMDVIIGQLTNLSPGDKTRSSFLVLCDLVVRNSSYGEHRHRAQELRQGLEMICNEEAETSSDKQLALSILDNNANIFQ